MPEWLCTHEVLVRENFRQRGAAWCATETGHTVNAVYRKAHLLGVARKKADHVIQATPQIDLMIRKAYGAGRIGACKDIERATGLPRRWISDRAHQLGLRLRGAHEVAFTPEQVTFIAERMHRSARTIAQDLRKAFGWKGPQRAVATQLVALRRAKDNDDRMSATAIGEIFGVPITTVTGWVKRGWLIAERVTGYGHGFRVNVPLLIGLGVAIALLPSLLVVALCTKGALRRDRHEGDSQPAVDDEFAPVVAGRAALDGLVAENDREADARVRRAAGGVPMPLFAAE